MITSPPPHDPLQTFVDIIEDSLGLHLTAQSMPRPWEMLTSRVRSKNVTLEAYLHNLVNDPSELQTWAQTLTVGETYFFRHQEQLRAFSELAVARKRTRTEPALRILSVGCSSGEEPYTLAILTRIAGLSPCQVYVTGFDVNSSSLVRARAGRYTAWSLRETSAELRAHWFRHQGESYYLEDSIVNAVNFVETNVVSPKAQYWLPESMDVIFCRNLLMYFSPSKFQAVSELLYRTLAPGGYLFLGHAESLRSSSCPFELLNTHNCFYYRKPERQPAGGVSSTICLPSLAYSSNRPKPSPSRGPCPAKASPGTAIRDRLTRARNHFGAERFAEALQALLEETGQVPEHGDCQLLAALITVNLGDYQRAKQTCDQFLATNGPTAGIHYLLGLCFEGENDLQSAWLEHNRATVLDPSFAMPRIHLGLIAKRSRNLGGATREFERAYQLLHHEKSERLHLFCSGFPRAALLALCRDEIQRLRNEINREP